MSYSSVLIVDDNPAVEKFWSAKFRAQNFDVIQAEDGGSALKIVKQHQPDLILLDIMAPGIDGFDLSGRMRQWSDAPIAYLDC